MPSWTARALAVTPLIVLVGWSALLAKDLLAVRVYEDPDAIRDRVDAIDGYEGHTEPVQLEPDTPDHTRIWVLGSSSVAAPHRDAFTRPLAAALDDHAVQVTNLGWEGMTSWDLRQRLETALAVADERGHSIDAAVLYLGHNDITYTYHFALAMPRFDALIAPVWVAVGEPFRERDDGDAYWLFAHRRVPRILDALQNAGWITLQPSTFEPLEERAVSRFGVELDRMLSTLARRDVPVLIVTPVGNLETRPFGVVQQTGRLWEDGMAATDEAQRLSLLMQARDSEVFTPDMRAKSALLDVMRSRAVAPAPGAPVQLCDLETRLPAKGLHLGDDLFDDPVHLSEAGFDAITHTIADCLREGVLGLHTPP